MREDLESRFREALPAVEFATLRYVEEREEQLAVRRGVVKPVESSLDAGAMLTVIDGGGIGYAATPDLSVAGLRRAAEQARTWALRTAGKGVIDPARLPRLRAVGEYESAVVRPWAATPLSEKLDLLREACGRLARDPRIIEWEAGLWFADQETLLLTSEGGRVRQRFQSLLPVLSASANEGLETQTRTLGGIACCRQGGLEILDAVGFAAAPERIAEQALELLAAPNCPSGVADVVLAPDQMILQIHESIGHPLELDRILGDERNYAGRSFVTLDMFGSYRYGSDLLNVTFDPTRAGELASYAFDDDGTPAERVHLIREGLLLRPLGGAVSQARAGIPGTANARATGWSRPPIDRMANLNLEAGVSRFEEMVASVEHGLYLETNRSWSIDDSRNKFQFGCEWGRRIEAGRLGGVVKNANYRGVSATFWRSLAAVGGPETVEVLGTPYCGKGEPNQGIRVGHASPACVFRGVDVFGGER